MGNHQIQDKLSVAAIKAWAVLDAARWQNILMKWAESLPITKRNITYNMMAEYLMRFQPDWPWYQGNVTVVRRKSKSFKRSKLAARIIDTSTWVGD